MRTTLKRRIGQANGAVNGSANGAVAPSTLTRIRRYRQPPSQRTALGMLGRIVFWIAAAFVMVVTAFGGGLYLFWHQTVNDLRPHTKAVRLAQLELKAPPPGRPAIALIIGYDKRWDEDGNGRSDTIMLVRADPDTKSISMLSFPRDLKVPIYCPGEAPFADRINAAYATCNVRGTVATIHHLTGLDINYLITVNFRGFQQVVDRLGGVWIDVDHRYLNRNVGTLDTNFDSIDLKPGYQRLEGRDALDFVRFRHTDSDLYRNARQQMFVKAIKERVQQSFDPFSIPKLIGAITNNVEIGRGGGRDITEQEVFSYALFAYRLPTGHFFQTSLDNLQVDDATAFYFTASQETIDKAVREFVNPDVSSPEKAEESALGRRPGARRVLRPKDVTVSVLNGNAVPGSAASARALLHDRGFRTVEPTNPLAANAPHQKYWHSTVYYDPAKPHARAGAHTVANAFGDAVVVRGIPPTLDRLTFGAMTVVVVGRTFHDKLAPAPEDTTPKKQPPVVRRDPSATLSMLRKAQRRVPFRLQVPTILERYSQPASSVPVRVYELARHRAVRLTFALPNGMDYWGIEQTDWEDAPVLQAPSTTRTIKGRRYDFYFNGPHLHMAVLRDGDASYWVVNTLTNALSNETMLAIAKGLRPVPKKHK